MPLTETGGFVVARKMYRIIFDGELQGLWMTVRAGSVAAYKRIAGLADREVSDPPTAEDIAAMSDLYESFAAVLVDWNLEEPAGRRVPTTLEGVESQEPAMVNALAVAWLEAVQRALSAGSRDMTPEEIEATLNVAPLELAG